MSKSLTDAESLHADQHDANAISSVVNCSDEAGQKKKKKMIKLDNSYDELAKRVSENLETSSTRKQDKRHKSIKKKINSPSSSPSPETVKCSNKMRREKSRSPSSSSSSSSLSSSSSTESENEIVDKMFKIIPKEEEFK